MPAPKQPEDHKKPAAQLEAEAEATAEVTYRDLTFTIVRDPDDWDVDTSLAFEDGKVLNALKAVLGEAQWAEFKKTRPKNRDAAELYEAVAQALGFDTSGN